MKLTLTVRDDKAEFFLELLKEFDFVTILSVIKEEDDSAIDN